MLTINFSSFCLQHAIIKHAVWFVQEYGPCQFGPIKVWSIAPCSEGHEPSPYIHNNIEEVKQEKVHSCRLLSIDTESYNIDCATKKSFTRETAPLTSPTKRQFGLDGKEQWIPVLQLTDEKSGVVIVQDKVHGGFPMNLKMPMYQLKILLRLLLKLLIW